MENKNEEQVLLEVLKEYYLAEIVSAKIINKYSFDLLLINEKGYSPASEIFKRFVKNNINVIQWVSSVNGDSFVFKKYNKNNFKMHPFSLDNQSARNKFFLNLKWDRKKEEIISKIKSFYLDGNWFNRQDLNKNKFFFDKKK